jgi:hypothetical protein
MSLDHSAIELPTESSPAALALKVRVPCYSAPTGSGGYALCLLP